MGLWETVKIHSGKLASHRNWPHSPGSTSEYSHTRSTPARDPEFQDATKEFQFQENKHVSKKKIHIADELSRLQVQGQTGSTTMDNDEMIARVESVISLLPAQTFVYVRSEMLKKRIQSADKSKCTARQDFEIMNIWNSYIWTAEWETVKIHCGKVASHRNWPHSPGSTSEY